jgi:hypothetical protein
MELDRIDRTLPRTGESFVFARLISFNRSQHSLSPIIQLHQHHGRGFFNFYSISHPFEVFAFSNQPLPSKTRKRERLGVPAPTIYSDAAIPGIHLT